METVERGDIGDVPTYDGFISYSHAADGLLAPRLQSGLQRFAKPWWKRRAIRVFRDESSLSANPQLWSSITEALDTSGWFVLLLSPDAAASPWVNQEIDYWKIHRDPSRILPVVTDGEFSWTSGDVSGSAVPQALHGVFIEEPRWVELRFAKGETQLDLKNSRFSAAVADIASALRGVPKDELESEEVKQHRRTIRTAWAAGTVLAVLAVVAVGASIVSARNARLARTEALSTAAVAALEAQSDPQLAKLLALEAVRESGSTVNRSEALVDTLFSALTEDRQVQTIDTGYGGYTAVALSSDDSRLVVASELGASVQMYAVPEGELVWEYREPETSDRFVGVFMDPLDEVIVLSVEDSEGIVRQKPADSEPNRLLFLDVLTGSLITQLEYPACASAQVLGGGWSQDGLLLALTNGWVSCPREGAPDGFWVEILDGETFASLALVPSSDPFGTWAFFGAENELIMKGFISPTAIYSPPSYSEATTLDANLGAVSRDGTLTSSVDPGNPNRHSLVRVSDGAILDRIVAPAHPAVPHGFSFSPDGSRFVIQTEGNQTVVWDVRTGEELFVLPTGRGGNPAVTSDGSLLYTSHTDGTVSAWSLEPRAVGQTVLAEFDQFGFVNGNHITVGPSLGATEVLDFVALETSLDSAQVIFFDPDTGELVGDPVPGSGVFALADGRFLITYWAFAQPDRYLPSGGAAIHDPATGETTPLYGCPMLGSEDCDAEPAWISVSTDRTEIMIRPASNPGAWRVLGLDGSEVDSGETGVGSWSWVSAFDPHWILGYSESEVGYAAVDRSTGGLLFSLGVCGCREEVSPQGNYLATVNGGRVTIAALGTWESTAVATEAGHVRGIAFNADETLLALGDDRNIHVIDLDAKQVIQTVPIGGVSDLHWLNDKTLLIGTADGRWATVTLDLQRLIQLTLDSLRSPYSDLECTLHGIEPCPSTLDKAQRRYAQLAG